MPWVGGGKCPFVVHGWWSVSRVLHEVQRGAPFRELLVVLKHERMPKGQMELHQQLLNHLPLPALCRSGYVFGKNPLL